KTEPMPDFSTRYPGKLESCLAQAFQSFGGKHLHHTLTKRAAVLFYLIIKNHPFLNGNKRMAVTFTLVFLFINGKFIDADPRNLYKIACRVANSKSRDMDIHIRALDRTFKQYLVVAQDPQDDN